MNARPNPPRPSRDSFASAATQPIPGPPSAAVAPAPLAASSGRVVAIDALRGFDMFWIVGGHGLVLALARLFWNPLPDWLTAQMKHVPWEGFSAWDLIMPLFLFVVIGANAIFAYMLTHPFNLLGDMANKIVGGLAQQLVAWGKALNWEYWGQASSNVLRAASALALLWVVLYYLYRNKTFIRV